MTGKTLLFDSNAILYLAQGNKTLLELTQNTGICISSFTRFEILSYWNIKQEEIILFEDFFNNVEEFHIDNSIFEIGIHLRKKYKMKTIDSLIAATAFVHNIPLVTCDKDFKNIEEITLLIIEL
jgi:predicted nucleic acid-binding protein